MCDSNTNPSLRFIRESVGIRLALLFSAFFILLSVTSLISLLIDNFWITSERNKGLFGAVLQCILAFIVPSVILARFCSAHPFRWLKCEKFFRVLPFIGVVVVYLLSLPAMEWLISWNSNLHFPDFLKDIEMTFRSWEENNAAISQMLLATDSIGGVITGILIIGILTGFSEELFFRGSLQGIFQRSSLGPDKSIWLAAIIFSALHFQFFGFFPRLIMGAFFGYLFIWTKSLWVPVFAHSLNNSVVVVISSQTENLNANEGTFFSPVIESIPYLLPVMSFLLTSLFLLFLRNYFFKKN